MSVCENNQRYEHIRCVCVQGEDHNYGRGAYPFVKIELLHSLLIVS